MLPAKGRTPLESSDQRFNDEKTDKRSLSGGVNRGEASPEEPPARASKDYTGLYWRCSIPSPKTIIWLRVERALSREFGHWMVLSARMMEEQRTARTKCGLVEGRGVEPPTPTLRT